MADAGGKYEEAWNRLRALERKEKRYIVALVSVFGVIPLSLCAIDRIYELSETVRLTIGVPYALAGVALWTLAVCNGFRLRAFPCPRCGKPFFRGTLSSPAGRKCFYCDLFVFQAKD